MTQFRCERVWVAWPNEIRLLRCVWNVSDRHRGHPHSLHANAQPQNQGSYASRHAATLFAGGLPFDTTRDVATDRRVRKAHPTSQLTYSGMNMYYKVFLRPSKRGVLLVGKLRRGSAATVDVYWQYRRVIVAATPDPGSGHAQTMSKCDISLEMLLLNPNAPPLPQGSPPLGSTKCICFAGIWIIFKCLGESEEGISLKIENCLMILAYWWMKLWHCLSISRGYSGNVKRKFIQFKYCKCKSFTVGFSRFTYLYCIFLILGTHCIKLFLLVQLRF